MNPLNQLPIDAAMMKRLDEAAEALAKETGHMILMVAMKENEKTQVTLAGRPESGLLHTLTEDVPSFIMTVAKVCMLHDLIDAQETRS